MSSTRRTNHAHTFFSALAGLACLTAPALAGPHALVPVPRPHFTIDLASPSNGLPTIGGPISAGAILDAPGPVVTHPANGLHLFSTLDELDEVSGSRIDVGPADTFVILFGVDRAAVGARGPDASLLPTRPFNVWDQAQRHQAAGDTFMTLDLYNRAGGPLPFSTLRLAPAKNNTLVINQGDTGGGDYDLIEDVSPLMNLPPGTPIDNTDGIYYDPPPALVSRPTTPGGLSPDSIDADPTRGIQTFIYFTLTRTSPSLNQLPGSPSGANVYADANPNTPFTESLYAAAGQIGLIPGPTGDDIDGLIVFDAGTLGVFEPGTDQIIFSLAPGSPSLGSFFSPADLFTSSGFGVFNLFARADDLGLLPTDNVDNLELLKATNASSMAFNSAIYLVIPGDFDGNGILNASDCAQFASCYTGPGGAATLACAIYDQDADGDVDCTDWRNNSLIYKQLNGGAACPPISIPEFVAALLGSPLLPAHACMADMNLDGKTDGRDIGPYTRALIGP